METRKRGGKKPSLQLKWLVLIVGVLVLIPLLLIWMVHGLEGRGPAPKAVSTRTTSSSTRTNSSQQSRQKQTKEVSDLPAKVSSKDWELVLVNRDHITPEMNPSLATVEGVEVDSRIAQAATDFLAAARQVDPQEHLISGYRSVAYQEQLYETYVAQEQANGNLSREEAEKVVQTYSQPAGASEHQTGLALDMSTVDALNQSDPQVVKALQQIAPTYGFVLRFESHHSKETGIEYEDWHWRYVGPENAAYMTKHNLSLEGYLDLLKQAGR